MGKYLVETDGGKYQVETEDSQPQNLLKTTGDILGGAFMRSMKAGPTSMLGVSGGPVSQFGHDVKAVAGEKAGMSPIASEALSGATDPQNMFMTADALKPTFNAMKKLPSTLAKPFTKIGSEITPKVQDIVSGRLKSMNQDALKAIGVSDESNRIAQEVGKRIGLEELPTKGVADSYYKNVIDSAPEDIRIPTTNLEKAISNPYNKLDSRTMSQINRLVARTSDSGVGTLEKAPISKVEYSDLRGTLNNIDPTGENPAVQAVKHALDADAEVAIPDLSKAKGIFQVSRELNKANTYLDNPKLGSKLQKQLESAGKMGNVQQRIEMSNLIGDEAPNIFKDIQKTQGLARLLKVAGSLELFRTLYKRFNALGIE